VGHSKILSGSLAGDWLADLGGAEREIGTEAAVKCSQTWIAFAPNLDSGFTQPSFKDRRTRKAVWGVNRRPEWGCDSSFRKRALASSTANFEKEFGRRSSQSQIRPHIDFLSIDTEVDDLIAREFLNAFLMSELSEIFGQSELADVLPGRYTLLLSGPPGVGKLEYMFRLMDTFLKRGERAVFVTLDAAPEELRTRAGDLGLRLEDYEGTSLLFVDAFTHVASDSLDPSAARGVRLISSYSNLEGMGMTIARAVNDLGPPVKIFFYSLSTLYLHNPPESIAKFVQILSSRAKNSYGVLLYAVQEGVHEPRIMQVLQSLVDGVLELKFNDRMERELRIHHLRGLSVSSHWRLFSLRENPPPEGGVSILTERKLENPRQEKEQ